MFFEKLKNSIKTIIFNKKILKKIEKIENDPIQNEDDEKIKNEILNEFKEEFIRIKDPFPRDLDFLEKKNKIEKKDINKKKELEKTGRPLNKIFITGFFYI